MNNRKSLPSSLALAGVVALGITIAWAVVVIWGSTVVDSAAMSQQTIEQLQVQADGEPVIVRHANRMAVGSQELLTLDRQPAMGNVRDLLYPSFLSPPVDADTNTMIRLNAVSNGGPAPTYWYLYHDGRTNGHAYGVGYHSVSKRVAGYFGRHGFSDNIPAHDDRFQVSGTSGLLFVATGASNSEPVGSINSEMYLLADEQLWAINVTRQSVSSLAEVPNKATLGMIWPTLAKLPDESIAAPGAAITELTARMKIAVRSSERLLIVDPRSGEKDEFSIPAEYRNVAFSCFELAEEGYLLTMTRSEMPRMKSRVAWLDSKGTLLREREISLDLYTGMFNESAGAVWLCALAAPAPLASVMVSGLMTLARFSMGEVDSLFAAAGRTMRESWPALLVTLTIGVVCAVATYRRHTAYGLPHAIWWTIFVFLMGIPGWLAYRFHRNWPVLADCPACHEPAPRDRDACAECGATFPPPPLKGLEIFA